MTLNLRRPVPHLRRGHPDAWAARRGPLRQLLAAERPTVLAVQEAVPEQVAVVREALGPDTVPVLVARGSARAAAGHGERVGMFVDGSRLRVVGTRSWALSLRPERPGSRSWGSLFPRVAVRAELEDLATGIRFAVLATHLDPFSPWALREQASMTAAIAGGASAARSASAPEPARDGGPARGGGSESVVEQALPIVLMADWNAAADSPSGRTLADGGLGDTWDLAAYRLTPEVGTLTRYRSPRTGGPRLDRILTRAGAGVRARVDLAAITSGAFSDHAAVHAVLRWEAV